MISTYEIGLTSPLGATQTRPGSTDSPWRVSKGIDGYNEALALPLIADGDYVLLNANADPSAGGEASVLMRYKANGGRPFLYRPNIFTPDLGTVDAFASEDPISGAGWGSILPTGGSITYDAPTDLVTILAGSSTGAGATSYLTSPSNHENMDYGFCIIREASVSGYTSLNAAIIVLVDNEVAANSENLQAWPQRFPTTWGHYESATATSLRTTVPIDEAHDIEIYVDFGTDTMIVYQDYQSRPSLVYTMAGTTTAFSKIAAVATYHLDTRCSMKLRAMYAGYFA